MRQAGRPDLWRGMNNFVQEDAEGVGCSGRKLQASGRFIRREEEKVEMACSQNAEMKD